MHLPQLRLRRRTAAGITGGIPAPIDRASRDRRRRGGPRTPLPLLPIIAVVTGVGLAYVSQTAKATQDNYNESHLIYVQGQLTAQDQELGDRLAALSASSRVIAEAERLGMVTGGTWTYAEEPSPSASASADAVSSTSHPSPSAGPALAAVAGALNGVLGRPGW